VIAETRHARDFNNSKLYMWRTIIALAHADGQVCESERAYLEGVLDRMRESTDISDEQYSTLRRDLTKPHDAMQMLAHVQDPRYRGQILYFARLLANKDGILCEKEQDILEKLEVEIGKDINISSASRKKLTEALKEENHTQGGFVKAIEKLFIK